MSADEDKKFNNEDFQLKDWLVSRGVDRTKAEKAEPPLLAGGFDELGITVEELTEINNTKKPCFQWLLFGICTTSYSGRTSSRSNKMVRTIPHLLPWIFPC